MEDLLSEHGRRAFGDEGEKVAEHEGRSVWDMMGVEMKRRLSDAVRHGFEFRLEKNLGRNAWCTLTRSQEFAYYWMGVAGSNSMPISFPLVVEFLEALSCV